MSRPAEVAIDLVEAAYDLERPPGPWLGHVVESGSGLIEGMERAFASIWSGLSEGGSEPLVKRGVLHAKVSGAVDALR